MLNGELVIVSITNKNHMKNSIYFLLIVLVALSCKKKEDRACWKVAGDETQIEVSLQHFNELFVGAHVEVVLIQDSLNKAVVYGHENLVNLIEFSHDGDKLSIVNKNKCNFLRSYKTKKIIVELHFSNLINIEFHGSEPMRSDGKLVLNYFTIALIDGAAPVTLEIDAEAIYTETNNGYGDFTFTGKAKYANFRIRSNSYCNTTNLEIIDSIDVITNTPVLSRVNLGTTKARVEINGSGNVEYVGNPSILEINQYGTGQLVDIN